MNIFNFKIFSDLVESKSFSKAAKINDITQSAVSQQIQAMERNFKTLLIDRTQKQFSLTQEGQLVYKTAKDILHTYAKLEGDLSELKTITSGVIRISTIYSIGLYELPALIQNFQQTYPAVNVRLAYRRADTIYSEVTEGMVDFGLVAYAAPMRQVEITHYLTDNLVLIMAPGHPLAEEKKFSIKMLAGQKFISFDTDTPTRKAIDQIFEKNGVSVSMAMEFDNVDTVKRAVEIYKGLAFVPHATVMQEQREGTLKIVEMHGDEYKRPLSILNRKGRVFTPAMKKFMDSLKTRA
ncbi:MAG: LysR family transcriptional regulator [Opitutaceae bacterium]|jgi:DNA-binding transcriptional LysR family regulator|nr:LysR family transcriptional regulator [Opitutaceae bacterium]